MSISVQCQRCGKKYRVSDDRAGLNMKCTGCDSVISVPETLFLDDDAFIDDDRDFTPPPPPRTRDSYDFDGADSPAASAPAQPKSKRGWFVFGGTTLVIAIAAVAVVLIMRWPAGIDAEEVFDEEARARTKEEVQNYGIGIRGDVEIRQSVATRFPLTYTLTIEKNGQPIGLSRTGSVAGGLEQPDPDNAEQVPLKIQPAPKDDAANKKVERKHLKRIALAMQQYEAKQGRFSPPVGKRGLSWRVHLLPYLGERELYERFKLDEPWDSPHNKRLIKRMPGVYKMANTVGVGTSTVHVFVGPYAPFGLYAPNAEQVKFQCTIKPEVDKSRIDESAVYQFRMKLAYVDGKPEKSFSATRGILGSDLMTNETLEWSIEHWFSDDDFGPLKKSDITDDLSKTILCIVAGSETSAVWTKPGGIVFEPTNPFARIGTVTSTGFTTVMFDGSVVTTSVFTSGPAFVKSIQHFDGNGPPKKSTGDAPKAKAKM